MELLDEIKRAKCRIGPHIFNTPLLYSQWLSNYCGGDVYLKMESEQITGSFKARGSLNKLMWLQERHSNALPVTASTGNHGLGFARSCRLLDMEGRVFLPHNAVSSKVAAIRAYDMDIEFYGDRPFETEKWLRKTAEENGWVYVSPYNDLQVIAGQGTIGIEILQKVPHPNNILVTVGGGGLVSGIGTCVKEQSPETFIIGCQPENSPEMSISIRAGKYTPVESKPTLSDGSAGGFERASITFGLCSELVDHFVLITENEIKAALFSMIKHHSKLIEGAAGVAIAGILKNPENFAGKTTIVIVCGANISSENLKNVLSS